ncbi:uncharacterized protein [Dysidea avara]|uniref:uncharacterized protein n=1 Tax=Dysidea avara TaxID=196820 RepID=UPI003325DB4B
MYGGNSLQRQLRTTNLVIPGDAPPKENRIHKRQKIIDELDMIKFRVDQITKSYEKETELYFLSSSDLDVSIPTLELSAVRDFFRKFMEKFLDETEDEDFEYSPHDDFQIPDINEFVSAIQDSFQMVHQLRNINAQLVEKMFDLLKKRDVQQHEKEEVRKQHKDQILSRYTQEAINSGRLEKTAKGLNEELKHLKSHNSYLVQANETGISRLNDIEISNVELEETIKTLRTEIKFLRNPALKVSAGSQQRSYQTSEIPSSQPEETANLQLQSTSQSKIFTHRQNAMNIIPSNNTTEIKMEGHVTSGVVSKQQMSVKHTSRLLEQQLNNMEELLMQGQKKIDLGKKEMADLTNMTDETLKHKHVTELVEWLNRELVGIDKEIVGSVQHYEQHKAKIEASQEVHLDQFSKKVNNSVEKISKSMKRLEMPVIDAIRKNVAGHLRKKHGINATSSSWRANAYMKKQKPIQRKVESRKLLIPSLANCVDFSEYGTNTNNKPPSKPALETIHLPVIHKHKPRSVSPMPEQITHLYHISRRKTVIDNQTRILAYRVP